MAVGTSCFAVETNILISDLDNCPYVNEVCLLSIEQRGRYGDRFDFANSRRGVAINFPLCEPFVDAFWNFGAQVMGTLDRGNISNTPGRTETTGYGYKHVPLSSDEASAKGEGIAIGTFADTTAVSRAIVPLQ